MYWSVAEQVQNIKYWGDNKAKCEYWEGSLKIYGCYSPGTVASSIQINTHELKGSQFWILYNRNTEKLIMPEYEVWINKDVNDEANWQNLTVFAFIPQCCKEINKKKKTIKWNSVSQKVYIFFCMKPFGTAFCNAYVQCDVSEWVLLLVKCDTHGSWHWVAHDSYNQCVLSRTASERVFKEWSPTLSGRQRLCMILKQCQLFFGQLDKRPMGWLFAWLHPSEKPTVLSRPTFPRACWESQYPAFSSLVPPY